MTIVLFLDSDWQPLRVEPWTRAITDLFLGKIEVIEYSRDRTIKRRGPRLSDARRGSPAQAVPA